MYKIQDLMPIGILFVVTTVALSIGGDITGSMQSDMVTGAAGCNSTDTSLCGAAYNITGFGLASLVELGSWLGTIAMVVAAAIIIGALIYSFAFKGR